MSTTYVVPLAPTPQTLSITLAGVTYNLRLSWNWTGQNWVLDLLDVNENPLVNGIPLVTGADLLAQYGYLNLGGQLVVQTTNDAAAVPTFTNLGSQSNLYFVTNP